MYQLNPASLDIESNKDEIKSIYKRSNTNSKTYKNKKNVNFAENTQNTNSKSNINSILSKLHINDENTEYDDNDENNFRQYHTDDKDFLENDKILQENTLNKPVLNKTSNVNESYSDPKKILSNFEDSYQDNLVYYNNINEPVSYNNNTNSNYNNKELLSKLEYIIQLLEEQHNEKTNHIVEELILYLFLGIFIIFVLDSFSKATKYTR